MTLLMIFRSLILALISFFAFNTLLSQDSLNMSILYHWMDSSIQGTTLYNNAYNEIWGYEKDGREYAIIGSTIGTHFFDITDPANSVQIDFVPGADQGTHIVHRDYHDYNGYLYMVSDEGLSTLQIVDLSYLPDSVHVVYDSDALFRRSHNIFIDSATAKMYVCGGENKFDVYSLANPTAPQLIVRCHLDVAWWSGTVGSSGYVHDVFVRNDTAYCNAGNGLYIVDFTNTSNPNLLCSYTTYVHKGYNHSGWLDDSGKVYAFADETHGKKIKLIDVSDFNNIQLLDTLGNNVHQNSIVHNLIIMGDYLYVSYYYDGVYIYNISNPRNPVLEGFYDCSLVPHGLSYKGAWGVYPFLSSGVLLASDMQNGLYVFGTPTISSIKEETTQNKNFNLFPNPTKDLIYLSSKDFIGFYNYNIFDVSGKQILTGRMTKNNSSISVSELNSGIYFINIQGKNTNTTKKIIVE